MKWSKVRKQRRKTRSFKAKVCTAFIRMDWDFSPRWLKWMIADAKAAYPFATTIQCVWNGELVGGYVSNQSIVGR